MAKKKAEKRQGTEGSTSTIIFPNLSTKVDLEYRVLLEDQVILLDVSIQSFPSMLILGMSTLY